jgi:hypothetical protein
MFINLVDNTFLDSQGFSPFGKVTSGMQIVHELYGGCAIGLLIIWRLLQINRFCAPAW